MRLNLILRRLHLALICLYDRSVLQSTRLILESFGSQKLARCLTSICLIGISAALISNINGRFALELIGLFVLLCLILGSLSRIHDNVKFDLIIILGERVAHIALKLDNCEVQFKLAVAVRQILLKERVGETADKAPLVILHYFIEVVFEELHLKVGQVKATVVVCRELVSRVYYDFVRVSVRHESVGHCFTNLEYLLVGGYQLVKLQRGVRVD